MALDLRIRRLVGVYGHRGDELPYHPLLNAEILRIVFSNFYIDECTEFRLVNRTWRDQLQQRWRNETRVSIVMQPEQDENNENLQPSKCVHNFWSIEHFLNDNVAPESISNIRACYTCFNQISLQNPNSLMYKFWSKFGPSLKILDLLQVKFATQQDATKLFAMTPNLEYLKFTSMTCAEPAFSEPIRYVSPPDVNIKAVCIGLNHRFLPHTGHFSASWLWVFTRFRNMKILVLNTYCWATINSDLNNIFDVVGTIRASMGNQVLNLAQFNLINKSSRIWKFNGRLATKFCNLQLPLSKMQLSQVGIKKDVFAQLIQSHRMTLKAFAITKTYGKFMYSFPYEVLPENLHIMCMAGRVFPTWKFLKYTPNLQSLFVNLRGEKYKGVYIRSCVEFRKGYIPVMTQLTELNYVAHSVVPVNTIKFLVKAMPNLTHLEMTVDVAGFKEIRNGWNLQECKVEIHVGRNKSSLEEYVWLLCAKINLIHEDYKWSDLEDDVLFIALLTFINSLKEEVKEHEKDRLQCQVMFDQLYRLP